jgi:hypothetical protein
MHKKHEVLSFKTFLDHHPEKAVEVRHLLISRGPHQRIGTEYTASLIRKCPELISLGCNCCVLEFLRPGDCPNLKWLSLESPYWDGWSASNIDHRWDKLEYMHLAPYFHIRAPISFGFPGCSSVKNIIIDRRFFVDVEIRDTGFEKPADLIAHTLAWLPESNVERIAHLTYNRRYNKEKLHHEPLLDLGEEANHIQQSKRVVLGVDNWIDIFTRSIEDREYVWRLEQNLPEKS